MTNTIDPDTLREWLEAHRSVTVLDVRSDDDRASGPSLAACMSMPTMPYERELPRRG